MDEPTGTAKRRPRRAAVVAVAVGVVAGSFLLGRASAPSGDGGDVPPRRREAAVAPGTCPSTDDLVPITDADAGDVVAFVHRYFHALHPDTFDPGTLWQLSDEWRRSHSGWRTFRDLLRSGQARPYDAFQAPNFVSTRAFPIESRNGLLGTRRNRDRLLSRAGVFSDRCPERVRAALAEATWYVPMGCQGCTPGQAIVIHRRSGYRILGL